jgi:hypothetical protein
MVGGGVLQVDILQGAGVPYVFPSYLAFVILV